MPPKPLLSSWLWRLVFASALVFLIAAVLYTLIQLITVLNQGMPF